MNSIDKVDDQIIESPSNRLQNISGTGEMSISGNLNLSGVYSGKLNVSESLLVGKEGVVIGEFKVKNLIVYGKVIGTVYVSNHAELHPNSQISGKIIAKEIKMHPGSKVNGIRYAEKLTTQEKENKRFESFIADHISNGQTPK